MDVQLVLVLMRLLACRARVARYTEQKLIFLTGVNVGKRHIFGELLQISPGGMMFRLSRVPNFMQ